MPEALLEHYQTTDATVFVLERMNGFKSDMEIQNVVERDFRLGVVFGKQGFDRGGDFGRLCGLASPDFVFQHLVVADLEPCFPAVHRPGFQDEVELLDKTFVQLSVRRVNHKVDAAEVVYSLNDVVNSHRATIDA